MSRGVAIAEVEVGVEDAFGNVVTTATDAVTIAIGTNPGGGTLSGTPTVSAVNGVAALSDLSIEKTGSGYTLGASAAGLTDATSAAFDITAAAAAQLAFLTPPGNATVRTTIAPAIEVEILDQFSNLVPTATDVVTLAIEVNPGDMLLHASGFNTPILERLDPVTFTVLPVLPNAPTPGEEIFGMTYYQPTDRVLASVFDFAQGNSNLASIDATGAVTTLGLIGNFAAGGPVVRLLVVEPGTGRVLAGDLLANLLCVIDPNTGAPTVLGPVTIAGDVILAFNGLSYHPTTGILYGVVVLASSPTRRDRNLVTIDVSTLTATNVAPLSGVAVSSIAFRPNGDLLALTGDQANFMTPVDPETLWLVDQATGALTLILALGNGDSGEVITTVPPTLTGSRNVTAVNGVAVFNVAIDGSGTGYILAATAPGLTFAESAAFDIIQ